MILELNETKEPSYYIDLTLPQQEVIQAAIEILEARMKRGELLNSAQAVKEYCQLHISAEKDEQFCCIFLDNQHRHIAFERLFYGTIDSARVHPRVIVRRALELNAAALIMVHNHPSGESQPSQQDIKLTTTIREALKVVDVRVLDHIVVGDSNSVSLAEQGLL
jgi:DNA repair protein RadC